MSRGGSARRRVGARPPAMIRLVLEAQVLSLNLLRCVADVLGSALGYMMEERCVCVCGRGEGARQECEGRVKMKADVLDTGEEFRVFGLWSRFDSWCCCCCLLDFQSATMNSCFFTRKQVVQLFFWFRLCISLTLVLLLFESSLLSMENVLMRSCS